MDLNFHFILITEPQEHFGSQGTARTCIARFATLEDALDFGRHITLTQGSGTWDIEEREVRTETTIHFPR